MYESPDPTRYNNDGDRAAIPSATCRACAAIAGRRLTSAVL